MMNIPSSTFGPSIAGEAAAAYGRRRLGAPPGRREARKLLRELSAIECAAGPITPNRPVVVYGAGTFGRMALDFLSDVGLQAAMVVDARAAEIRRQGNWEGIELCAPEEVPDSLRNEALLAVSIVTSPVLPIMDTLRDQGWRHVAPFYDLAQHFSARHPLSNGWFAKPLTDEGEARVAACLDGWADDLSRAHHLMFLAWRLARQEWRFEGVEIDNSNRFLIPDVLHALPADGPFIDGGAHQGSVSAAFLAATGAPRGIIAFEPDPVNAEGYASWMAAQPDPVRRRIRLRRVALDAQPGPRRFHAGLGFMSRFADTGADWLDSSTLDAEELAPAFIKLHLEGGELDALKGGLRTIRKCRPVIAATIYHNADGLWRTAHWLATELDGYRLLMRNHSWCGTGAVIYALPDAPRSGVR